MKHDPIFIRKWNDFAVPLGVQPLDLYKLLYKAFVAGWESRDA